MGQEKVLETQQGATARKILSEVYEQVNWAYLAKNYFGKTRSWLYHKFSGVNNGKPDDFSDVDKEKLRFALNDIAHKLQEAAAKL